MVVGISSAVCSILGIGFLGYLVVLARRGTDDRAQADADRRFLDEHGHWPDEPPPAARRGPAAPPPTPSHDDQKAGKSRDDATSPPSGP